VRRATLAERARRLAAPLRCASMVTTPQPHTCTYDLREPPPEPEPPGPHFNPAHDLLHQEEASTHLKYPSAAVWPVTSLRSGRLPYVVPETRSHLARCDACPQCGVTHVWLDSERLSDVERVWRHVHHALFQCSAGRALFGDLLSDIHSAATRGHCAELAAVIDELRADGVPAQPNHKALSLLLDPAGYCTVFASLPGMGWEVQRLVAAFCLQAGAALASWDVDKLHIDALHLPADSLLLRRVFPVHGPVTAAAALWPDLCSESEDELIPPWTQNDSPDLGPADEPHSCNHTVGASAPPVEQSDGGNRTVDPHGPSASNSHPSYINTACDLSGPPGLQEADAQAG
jgi:hypothetical protein